jgi:hypothetical protein
MDGELANDYLYRNAVPGHPEFNTMNTDFNVGGHNINNAAAITATGNVTTGADVSARNVTATGTVTAATANVTGETYTGGWFRTRGTPAGTAKSGEVASTSPTRTGCGSTTTRA